MGEYCWARGMTSLRGSAGNGRWLQGLHVSETRAAVVRSKETPADLIAPLIPEPSYRGICSTGPERNFFMSCKENVSHRCICQSMNRIKNKKRAIILPWSLNYNRCKTSKSIDHVFVCCSNAVFSGRFSREHWRKDGTSHYRSCKSLPKSNSVTVT